MLSKLCEDTYLIAGVMKPEQIPFPASWWATSLDNIGLAEQRPNVGTYGRYEHTNLPELPLQLTGEFAWLREQPRHKYHIGTEHGDDIGHTLTELRMACKQSSVALPKPFLEFFESPELHASFRSVTDCYLDLTEGPVPSPEGSGVLIRFLADSQGCIYWYLYIPTGSGEHAVVASSDFYEVGNKTEEQKDEKPDPLEIVFAEQSFEAFMCRFWIENELWLSKYYRRPMNEIGRRYLEIYRTSPPDPLSNSAQIKSMLARDNTPAFKSFLYRFRNLMERLFNR